MSWLNSYVDDYYNWLKKKTIISSSHNSDWAIIDTPFLGAFNDTIELYVLQKNGKILLSDNGETFNNLSLLGINIQGSKKRRDFVDAILLNYGISQNNSELFTEANQSNFSQKKHNLISAIIELNDLYVLSENNVSSIFKEDVRNFLDDLDIIYTANFISKGVTGLEFNFDFQIAKREKETVIKSFNTIHRGNLSSFLFSWEDIKPVREKASKKNVEAIAIINDANKEVKTEFLDAFLAKKAQYILWSQRNEEENKLKIVA